MIDLYGIPNCDTVRKTRAWLKERGLSYTFHDFKKEGMDAARLGRWADVVGWEALLNRRGTTFRKLDAGDKADLTRDKALALMAARPSSIKRPVVEHGDRLLVAFVPEEWNMAFGV